MCFRSSVPKMTPPKKEFKNRPVTVSGTQTGVDNPKDTAKVTEALKIQRQKEEGTYVDPNLTAVEDKSSKATKSKQGRRFRTFTKLRDDSRQKAKDLAKARMNKKYKTSPTGRQTGVD